MKSFFFQVLYCGYKSFGWWIFTKARNPCGRNENSNTIYSSDPAHGLDARTGGHSRLERKDARKGSFSDIDHMYYIHISESAMYSRRTSLTSGKCFNGFHNPFALKPFNNTVGHPDININKGNILVHPIILSTCVCHHQHFQGLLVIFYCFHWQFKAATWVSDFNVRWPSAWQSVRHEQNCSSTVKKPNPSDRFLTLKENLQN